MKGLFKIIILGVLFTFVLSSIASAVIDPRTRISKERFTRENRTVCPHYLVKAIVDKGLCDVDDGMSVQVYVENYSDRPLTGLVLYSFEVMAKNRDTGEEVARETGFWASGPVRAYHLINVPAHSTVLLGNIIFDDFVNRALIPNTVYKVYNIAVEQYRITSSDETAYIGRLGTPSVEFVVR